MLTPHERKKCGSSPSEGGTATPGEGPDAVQGVHLAPVPLGHMVHQHAAQATNSMLMQLTKAFALLPSSTATPPGGPLIEQLQST